MGSCCLETACESIRRWSRIVDDRHASGDRFGENPLPLQHRGHRGCTVLDALALSLIIREERRFFAISPPAIPPNWFRRCNGFTGLVD